MDEVDRAGVVRAGDGLVIDLLDEALLLQLADGLGERVASDMELLDESAPVRHDHARRGVHAAAQGREDDFVEVGGMHLGASAGVARGAVRPLLLGRIVNGYWLFHGR